jgi:ERCC4-related helicase
MLTACLLLLAADSIRLLVPQQQALVVAGFRTAAINVLIATSVGSEGGWVR